MVETLATHRKHLTKSSIFVNGEFIRDFTDLEISILDISGLEIPKEKKAEKPKVEHTVKLNGHVKSDIRPCIKAALEQQLIGDSGNFMRVAACREYYNSGIQDPEKLIDLFRPQADFSYGKTSYHVRKVIEKPLPNTRCKTLQEKGDNFVNCAGCYLHRRNSYFINQVEAEVPNVAT
jgi:DNA primase large subunit